MNNSENPSTKDDTIALKTNVEERTINVIYKETSKGKKLNQNGKNGLKKMQYGRKDEIKKHVIIQKRNNVTYFHYHKLSHASIDYTRNQTKYYQ